MFCKRLLFMCGPLNLFAGRCLSAHTELPAADAGGRQPLARGRSIALVPAAGLVRLPAEDHASRPRSGRILHGTISSHGGTAANLTYWCPCPSFSSSSPRSSQSHFPPLPLSSFSSSLLSPAPAVGVAVNLLHTLQLLIGVSTEHGRGREQADSAAMARCDGTAAAAPRMPR